MPQESFWLSADDSHAYKGNVWEFGSLGPLTLHSGGGILGLPDVSVEYTVCHSK